MHSFDDLHDVMLVSRSQAGDRAALELLIRRYQRVLYTVALRMLGHAREARDATRVALVRTHTLLSLRHPDYGFFHAAHRLLVDECLDRLRSRPHLPTRAPIVDEDAGDAMLFRTLTFDERRHRMHGAILQLLPELRAVVVLRHVAGLSYDETAITLDLSRETVRSRLHLARQQLGERLMAWSVVSTLPPEDETLLQDAIDGELDYRGREARDRVLAAHTNAHARATALRDLGHLLNSLGPEEPPGDLTTQVLSQIHTADTIH